MTKPTFSIIIPTYNRIELLRRALNSLRGQTYDHSLFEIIVVDDGSTDSTSLYVRGIESFNVWRNLRYHGVKKNQGRIAARNKGMELATKDWICWLDSDDEYVSTYLEVFAKAITENPECKIFTAGTVVYDEQLSVSRLRDAFMPGVREDGRGCLPFKSGGVSTGGFVFRRELSGGLRLPGQARSPY